MSKYVNLEQSLFNIFNGWTEEIKIFPDNYENDEALDTFLRFSILPMSTGINLKSLAGVIIVDIFTPSGSGPRMSSTLADTLDSYLLGKSIESEFANTQFGSSTLKPLGKDKDDPTLFRTQYIIPFNFYGEN